MSRVLYGKHLPYPHVPVVGLFRKIADVVPIQAGVKIKEVYQYVHFWVVGWRGPGSGHGECWMLPGKLGKGSPYLSLEHHFLHGK